MNIALANEYACFADAHGLDVAAAIRAANTQPYSHIHSPGVGVGGHCIPVYPYFLLAGVEKPDQFTLTAEVAMLTLPRSARHINDAMAEYAVQRIETAIGSVSSIVRCSFSEWPIEVMCTKLHSRVRNSFNMHCLNIVPTVYVDDPLFSESELDALGYTPLIPEYENEIDAIHSAGRTSGVSGVRFQPL